MDRAGHPISRKVIQAIGSRSNRSSPASHVPESNFGNTIRLARHGCRAAFAGCTIRDAVAARCGHDARERFSAG